MNRKVLIGLTGGVATGKSTVLKEFGSLGARIFDCDRIAREVVEPGQPALRRIREKFGGEVLQKDRSLNRPALAEIVFHDTAKRKALEDIVHPEVMKVLKKKIGGVRSGLVVADIPLLFEAGWDRFVNQKVVVWSTASQQVDRLTRQRRLSKEDALALIRSQWPTEEKKRRADFVIDNSGSRARARSQVRQLVRAFNGKP